MIGELADYLHMKGWEYQEVQGGSQVRVKDPCPFCGKKNKMFFNADNGLWNCFYVSCPEADGGNLITLRRKLGDLEPRVMPVHMVYAPSRKMTHIKKTKRPIRGIDDRLHEALWNEPAVLDYLQKVRGFTEETIKHFKVGFADKKEKRLVAVPFYIDKELTNIKFRTMPPDEKEFRRVTGCESTLFNQDSLVGLEDVPSDERVVYVLESETDCMAIHQFGFPRCVASSAGAGTWSESWLAPLEPATEILLIYDNDEAGEAGAAKAADVLGRYRCKRALPKLHDVAEMLAAGMSTADMQECIDKAEIYEDGTIKPTSAFGAALKAELMSPQPRGRPTGWFTLDALWGGVRDGELTVVTGDTGSGKSTWTTEFAYNRVLLDEPVFIAPFEMRPHSVVGKLVSMRSGASVYDLPIAQLDQNIEELCNLPFYWFDCHGKVPLEELKDAVYLAVRRYGVRFVLLDHLHYFLVIDSATSERVCIDNAMTEIHTWCTDLGIHIMLVVHPHQLYQDQSGKTRKPDLSNLKGASSIKQTADNGIRVHRPRSDNRTGRAEAVITLLKCRSPAGTEGSVYFTFDRDSETYTEKAPHVPRCGKDAAAGEDKDEEGWDTPV